MSNNSLISPDFEDRLDTDGTYLQDCCNIEICSARDISLKSFISMFFLSPGLPEHRAKWIYYGLQEDLPYG